MRNTRAAATQSRSRALDCARVGGRTALQLGVMSSDCLPPPTPCSHHTPALKAADADAERSILIIHTLTKYRSLNWPYVKQKNIRVGPNP